MIYHVTTRGNRKEEIFTDTRDRLRFLQLLEQIVTTLEWRCHTYCLMTNHYHLLVQTSDADISRGMHRLNGVYAKWFNWRSPTADREFRPRPLRSSSCLISRLSGAARASASPL